ncbi:MULTISPECIES: GNAT family N-acetyltransferase [unclassified Paenarthrobacter]|uniref:GNAT family N-acetyltransferase n=2 Tax=Micrococcaceae TaxID=1268 RepID=UPI00084EBD8A|nr:GNAT family N-acetyltransferase [Paenarthrobacter sp. MSM-2-10-13]NKR13446.1 hypothetical protein [Arthrobacter sp. M5]NKR15257.1 hypothetical protein [Arthrobacter sp. M6]OEH58457.1 hypothetical protein A5N13_21350 [Arthrobacter sp. D4]OEH61747.1 hypothetical protein A5N17_13145 [Arthrobacter sp. D2]QMU81016.1 GNAT family N-acetyltransferase [Paenarthrobacter ureafaciens]
MFIPDSPYLEPGFVAWKQRLEASHTADFLIREAEQTEDDGRNMRWVQADCESTNIHSVESNIAKIGQQLVLLAEIADYPVGFCCVLAGRTSSDPLFIQQVTVVPLAQKRGIGLALLNAAAEWQPERNIAMATLDDNGAARRLNASFARSIGGRLQRVPLRRFRRSDLGFASGERHRPWMIDRQQKAD